MPRKERGQYVISSLIKQQKTKEKKEDKIETKSKSNKQKTVLNMLAINPTILIFF